MNHIGALTATAQRRMDGLLRLPRSVLYLVAVAISVAAPSVAADPPATLSLYHAFAVGTSPAAADVTVALRDGEWHVGRPDGPTASPEQIQQVLESLNALVIGCDCRGTHDGNTFYPCILELSHPRVDIAPPENQDVLEGWWATSQDLVARPALGVIEAASLSDKAKKTEAVLGPPGTLAVHPDFLGLLAPRKFRLIASSPTARSINFRAYAHPSEMSTTPVEPSSGVVVLSTGRLRPDPAWPFAADSI